MRRENVHSVDKNTVPINSKNITGSQLLGVTVSDYAPARQSFIQSITPIEMRGAWTSHANTAIPPFPGDSKRLRLLSSIIQFTPGDSRQLYRIRAGINTFARSVR